jgi:uncharacterized protein YndB with AHSA1/START domain
MVNTSKGTSAGGSAVVTLPSDTQILIAREFEAPAHLIYKAWTTPELIKRWWCSRRGAVTIADVDLRVGGKWRWVMMTDRGVEVAFRGWYREIVPSKRLVYTEMFEAVQQSEDDEGTLNTMTLIETNGRTLVTTLVEAYTREVRDMILNSGMEAGMQDAYDLLEQVAKGLE